MHALYEYNEIKQILMITYLRIELIKHLKTNQINI